ncbi:PqiC family protein [Rhodobacter lacus]|uniref:Membrane integrity-associated transporter subunit PqiC n=1 Tax=Rhodobacter lacus TaxID=1641972 RepID=A0ABW5A8G4_9RHOB
MRPHPSLIRKALPLVLCATLTACSGDDALYLIEPPAPAEHLPNRLGRVELREVVLPQYATAPEVTAQEPGGALRAKTDALWADAPGAAITRVLASQISQISGATAVAEPWPLSAPPDRRLEVRVAQILAGADGLFHLTGQYFVAPVMGAGQDVARTFAITVPLANSDPATVAAAQAQALQQLAAQIAALK